VRSIDEVLKALEGSEFRSRQRLGTKDAEYLRTRGLEVIAAHARDFINKRLAPAQPLNDGKQTPWRGHPVFVAQHATATCCRGCLAKWHGIPKGRELTPAEVDHVVNVIQSWIRRLGVI
jgi:hypothetical protein